MQKILFQETTNCSEQFGHCEQICQNNAKKSPKCACQMGYKLSGPTNSLGHRRECRAIGPNPLLLASITKGQIHQLDLVKNAFLPLQKNASNGIMFDYWYGQGKLLQYTDKGQTHNKLTICPLNLTTTNMNSIIEPIIDEHCETRIFVGYSSTVSIAFDWVHQLLFTMGGKNKGVIKLIEVIIVKVVSCPIFFSKFFWYYFTIKTCI